ncbi:beta-phosphoglucomutase family hydrolase [Actinoplanes sp. NPDC023714]|uniref:beta-phosphoglucomutase family hydrolase n=1 Tax=Actinoplanes sp. NPDC023714 TaxID=3154322 RepID=UPI003409906E
MVSAVTPQAFDAVLFDLDGVLTSTRTLHATAWKRAFDAFLHTWDTRHGTSTAVFDEKADYAAYVDGKPRRDGVRDFLAARGIVLPEGAPDSGPGEESVWGLSNRKQALVDDELKRSGVEAFPGSVAWVRELREAGLRTAVVSSSRNCAAVLASAGIANLFDTRVDGTSAQESKIPGKPAPDMFLEAARRLDVTPARAVVVEDALAGVQAGRAGGFGLVIGVDRDEHAAALAGHGADLVVRDLGELLAASSEQVHRTGPRDHRLLAAARRIVAATDDYPADPWRMLERSYNPEGVEQTETLFAVGNGFLGIRGSFEEGEPSYRPATLLNGFHETWPIVYPEAAHGFATTGQTILPVPDGTAIRLFVDEEPLTCARTEVREFERALDMRRGVLDRTVVYQLGDGRRFRVRTSRFVSLAERHLACVRYELTALDAPGRLVLSSELVTRSGTTATAVLDPRQTRDLAGQALRPDGELTEGARVIRTYRTANSGLAVAAGMDHEFDPADLTSVRTRVDADRARVLFDVHAPAGRTVTLTKWLAYHYGGEDATELISRASMTLSRATTTGHAGVLAEHEDHITRFWQRSEVVWEGGQAAQQAVRFNLFSILQATLRSAGHGMPAKGVTGTGYEGHYFWDTEAYVLPFLIHTAPEVARSLLMHGVRMLPDARRRAAEVGCAGALFPWRTISGEEASAYYAAGTAQYHINADIAYALDQYVTVTGDTDLLFRHGVELLVETARMWAHLGFYSERRDGRFVIHKVTGPDEYSTVVDNNLFTNLMAAENLRLAADAVDRVRAESPADHRRMAERTGLRDEEPAAWRRAAELMFIPYDEQAGVHLQDDSFMDQAGWDFAGTPADRYPLLLHYHPLVIYRHRVIKQADVVFATVLLPDRFSADERRRIFALYDPLTTGDSSLSECVQAIAAADVGKYRTAEEYLVDAAAVDMADTAGNLRDGIHVASAGGTWMALVYGFAGYRWRGRVPRFAPMLPPGACASRCASAAPSWRWTSPSTA